jgi:adenylate cyclase
MDDASTTALAAWATAAGLAGKPEPDLLRGFGERAVAAGLPIVRAVVIVDTLHPVYEGRVFRWHRDQADASVVLEYERTDASAEAEERWRRSPFYAMLETGQSLARFNLARGDGAGFPQLEEAHAQGDTEYLALIHRFAAAGVVGGMDCVYSAWVTDAAGGFTDRQAEALAALVPSVALAIKCASLARIAGTLVETYLGRDAGRRVLAGHIARGVADKIAAVLWYSDLRGFTRITDTARPREIIPLLNDYAECTISAIHDAGGDVLKLIGDGTLAIFKADDAGQACRCALEAAEFAGQRVAALNERRAASELPVTQAYLGLHVGEMFYGNVGSQDRLDFTVVGPAVNEVARIAAMCRSAERDVLLSAAFVAAAREGDRARLVSVGRYALRGVGRAQELFTLE